MFLETIVNHKLTEVAARKIVRPEAELLTRLEGLRPVRNFREALRPKDGVAALIAEIKQASPSKGLLCPNFDPGKLASIYETGGAAAISVLTEEKFFLGSLKDLETVRGQTQKTPLLRKDFVVDPYQIIEARVFGADAVLLIVAALSPEQLRQMIHKARDLGLTPLVEAHTIEEVEIALAAGADVIGINNRNLKTFAVDPRTTFQLIKAIPPGVLVVSESGIKNHQDILALTKAGVAAVLVGESLVTAANPGLKLRELLGVAS
ncbi:MAG: indole-3-glycerol phosphate synthase TrpC [Firmicutes bacterium]|nr:indole-3-glycerol phosphate synthase TrpC [Bacillota bacterium]